MKNAREYIRKLRRAVAALKPTANKLPRSGGEDVTEHLLIGLLMQFAPDSAAWSGYRRLREGTVDLNDLRVTPVAEMVELLGPQFPHAREAAELISRVLNAIFNRCHHLDLNFLRDLPRREAREYLESLDGTTPFAAGIAALHGLGHPTLPVDDKTLAWLRARELVPPDASHAEVHALLDKAVSPNHAAAWCAALRRALPAARASSSMQRGAARRRSARRAATRPPAAAARRKRPLSRTAQRPRKKSARRAARRR